MATQPRKNVRTNRDWPTWHLTDERSSEGSTLRTYTRLGKSYSALSGQTSFAQHAWTGFDLRQTAALLLNGERSFAGHKECVFAALCGWVADPKDVDRLRQSRIALTAAEILAVAEQRFTRHRLFKRRIESFYGRFVDLPPPFFTEIYYPIGGLRRIMDAASTQDSNEKTERAIWNHQLAATMMGINHQRVAASVATNSGRPITNERAADIVHVVLDVACSIDAPIGSKIRKSNYSAVKRSLPLSYAAQSIRLPTGGTLFEAIFSPIVMDIDYAVVCQQWFARSLYAAQTLMIGDNATDVRQFLGDALPTLQPEPFDPPAHIAVLGPMISDLYKPMGMEDYSNTGGKRDSFLRRYGIEPRPLRPAKGYQGPIPRPEVPSVRTGPERGDRSAG